MEYTKDYLTKKFLNPLFFDKDGNRILKEIQAHFGAQNLSLNKFLTEFEHIVNLHDPSFWSKIASIINSCFNSNIDITKHNLNREDAELYTNLKDDRHDASYATTIRFSQEIINGYENKVLDFINKTEELISR